jgi:histidinol dehydrogenase
MKLELTTEQINQILNALAEQPYIQVHELIATIQQQGNAQLQEQSNGFQESQPAQGEVQEHLAEVALETVTNGNG